MDLDVSTKPMTSRRMWSWRKQIFLRHKQTNKQILTIKEKKSQIGLSQKWKPLLFERKYLEYEKTRTRLGGNICRAQLINDFYTEYIKNT